MIVYDIQQKQCVYVYVVDKVSSQVKPILSLAQSEFSLFAQ